MFEISKEAAQAIVYVIKFHLEDYGLDHLQPARNMAISIAADVKKIMLKEMDKRMTAVVWGEDLDA